MAGVCLASPIGDELASFDEGLDAKVFVPNVTLTKNPQTVKVKITVTNPFQEPMPFYILKQTKHGWEIIKLGGALPASTTTNLELNIELSYEKESRKNQRFAIVGKGPQDRLYGLYFEIKENWTEYERSIRDKLGMALTIFVPLMGLVIIVLVASLAHFAYGEKDKDRIHKTMFLFTQKKEPETFEQKFADVFLHPFAILIEILFIVVLIAILADGLAAEIGLNDALQIIAISGLGAFLLPFIYFASAWLFERHEEGKSLRLFASMFIWGMFAAFLALITTSTIASGQIGQLAPYFLVAIILIAPIAEEFFKGIGILFVSGHKDYDDTLTGLLMGFSCGLGFAFIENWFYFSAKINPFEIGFYEWGMMMLYRSFFNSLAHGCFTAAISAPIGYLRSITHLRRYARLAFIPGLFLAIIIHTIFNLSALADTLVVASQEIPFFIFNPMLIIVLVSIFFLVLVFAVIDEKKRRLHQNALQTAKKVKQ
ncbi:MAG: PrsW family intramembrane metalloprotease [Candidatus Micrarchaeota archaeon]|nr:PrsW family intramembrane metalloprotease [Candidatus Micrarchaeota archaeon]